MQGEQCLRYLKAMGIQVWVTRDHAQAPAPESEDEAPVLAAMAAASRAEQAPTPAEDRAALAQEPVTGLDWPELEARVAACTACAELAANRTQTVFGVGNRNAQWMIIGEAPGADEDRQGEPFVGRAGKLLNNMLRAVGLEREQVYIANILKCRPPNNRDPKPQEAGQCRPFLQRQIELVKPKLIVVVGRIAAHNLLETDEPLGRLRGRVHQDPRTGVPVIVTYHPAYLLRTPADKAKAWQDLKLARRVAQGEINPGERNPGGGA